MYIVIKERYYFLYFLCVKYYIINLYVKINIILVVRLVFMIVLRGMELVFGNGGFEIEYRWLKIFVYWLFIIKVILNDYSNGNNN